MKKLVPIIIGIIIGAVSMYFFAPKPMGKEVKPNVSTSLQAKKKPKAPKDTITCNYAKKLSENWEKNNDIEMKSKENANGKKKKMRSVWWSLEEVNEYLAFAKEESTALGYTMTGIRVYLGNYGDTKKGPNKKQRNTMFIVPTGPKNVSKGSSLNISLQSRRRGDIPAPPLNDGTGGESGYPQ